MKMDFSKDYGTIQGAENGARYEQFGVLYDGNGDPIGKPVGKPAAKAARSETVAPTAQSDQVAKQLAS